MRLKKRIYLRKIPCDILTPSECRGTRALVGMLCDMGFDPSRFSGSIPGDRWCNIITADETLPLTLLTTKHEKNP